MNLIFRTAFASLFILWSALMCTPIHAAEQSDNGIAWDSADASEKKQAAIDMAKLELAKLPGMDVSTFNIISVEEYSWPDSSLGCAKRNAMSTQVVTPGYIVTIATSTNTQRVHATDKYAVMCEQPILSNPHHASAPLRNLNDMFDKARNDLATRLHVHENLIRIVTYESIEWPDTSMGCVVDNEPVVIKLTKGYRIALNYAGRVFVYHTDMTRVRACPAIDAQ